MNQKENNQFIETKYIRNSIGLLSRKLTDMTNFAQLRQNDQSSKKIILNPSKIGRIPDIKLFNIKTNKYQNFPCFDEKYLKMNKSMALKLKERKQDDDCNSDEEVVDQSIQHNFKNLIKALGVENEQIYNQDDYFD